ncbi:MAG: hypothetical protein AAF989_11325, partial [Planctomycetota bacterium]
RQILPHFFAGTPQREAIARLHYLVAGGLDAGVMISETGCGLTTLLQHVSQSTGFGDTAIQTILTRGKVQTAEEVWTQLANQLRLPSQQNASSAVIHQCRALSRQLVRPVWFMDDCTETSASVARTLIESDAQLTVVLGTSIETAREACLQIGQCPLRIDLPPLSLEDSIRFTDWSLRLVRLPESKPPAYFTDTALVRLHELSEGRMGWIGRIAELSLMIAAAHQMRHVDVDLLESVQGELVRAA